MRSQIVPKTSTIVCVWPKTCYVVGCISLSLALPFCARLHYGVIYYNNYYRNRCTSETIVITMYSKVFQNITSHAYILPHKNDEFSICVLVIYNTSNY